MFCSHLGRLFSADIQLDGAKALGSGRKGAIDDAIPAVTLRFVEGIVGGADQISDIEYGGRRKNGSAEAGSDLELTAMSEDGLLGDRESHRFAACLDAGDVAAGEDDDEFLTTVAANPVIGANTSKQPSGDFFEDVVTGEVAMGVVDILKVVNVHHQNADRGGMTGGPGLLTDKYIDN